MDQAANQPMSYAERKAIEEAQRRREQLIDYLQQANLPSDEQSQNVIALLKGQIAHENARLAARS